MMSTVTVFAENNTVSFFNVYTFNLPSVMSEVAQEQYCISFLAHQVQQSG